MTKKNSASVFSHFALIEKNQMEEYLVEIRKLVRAAQYKRAYHRACEAFEKYPNNRFAQYRYAVSLGDSSQWTSKMQQLENSKKAKRILRKLLFRTKGIDENWRAAWKNEYYWFSNQPQKQYLLGKKLVKLGIVNGHYAMGVGATSSGIFHYKKNRKKTLAWTEKAIDAWQNYFKHVPDYYNAYVWYAKALGLSGDMPGMEKALKKAAKLSGRPLSYREFTEAREEVLKITGVKTKRK